jgi:hypothetical protein
MPTGELHCFQVDLADRNVYFIKKRLAPLLYEIAIAVASSTNEISVIGSPR